MKAKNKTIKFTDAQILKKCIERRNSNLFIEIDNKKEFELWCKAEAENDEETLFDIENRILLNFLYMRILWQSTLKELTYSVKTVNERI